MPFQNVTSTFYPTEPERPQDITVTARGTDSLNITWTLPKGSVDHYIVDISNENLMYSDSDKTNVTAAHITDLYPGRIFVITVTAVAGDFNNTSEQSSFATGELNPTFILYVFSNERSLSAINQFFNHLKYVI